MTDTSTEDELVENAVSDEVRYAVWFAQYKHSGGTDEESNKLAKRRVEDDEQRGVDRAALAALVPAIRPLIAQQERARVLREVAEQLRAEGIPCKYATEHGITLEDK